VIFADAAAVTSARCGLLSFGVPALEHGAHVALPMLGAAMSERGSLRPGVRKSCGGASERAYAAWGIRRAAIRESRAASGQGAEAGGALEVAAPNNGR
jgi:hypothetical protein